MRREEIWKAVSDRLREDFGRLLDVRDVRRVRRVSGEAWVVTVALAASSGDLHVADLTVDDAGGISPALGADHVVEAVRRAQRLSHAPSPVDELADFGEMDGDDAGAALALLTEEPVDRRVADAIARGDTESLGQARDLLPRLLADHEGRGSTLFTMAQVEAQLGQPRLARGYLEAAAREFADRLDLAALEAAAVLASSLEGHEGFTASPIHALLTQSRARLVPLGDLFQSRSFAGVGEERRQELARHAVLRRLAPGETLVTEGNPSCEVFVVKSGLLGVWLEKPSGGAWMVRSCFPGWLLGESSVLGAIHGLPPRCTASLRAERVSEVWMLPATRVRALMEDDPAFAQQIAETKQIHRIDSFFSMHETMGQLDVHVRDEVLSCLEGLESFEEETVLLLAGVVPDAACLVARGSLALFHGEARGTPVAIVEPDSFYGVRDAIHRVAPAVTAIARPGTTVAFFDARRLQKLCEQSPEQVVAVLERLG